MDCIFTGKCIFDLDICLFLAKKKSEVDSYDCTHFDHGCPTGFYTGATMYKCKYRNELEELCLHLKKNVHSKTDLSVVIARPGRS